MIGFYLLPYFLFEESRFLWIPPQAGSKEREKDLRQRRMRLRRKREPAKSSDPLQGPIGIPLRLRASHDPDPTFNAFDAWASSLRLERTDPSIATTPLYCFFRLRRCNIHSTVEWSVMISQKATQRRTPTQKNSLMMLMRRKRKNDPNA